MSLLPSKQIPTTRAPHGSSCDRQINLSCCHPANFCRLSPSLKPRRSPPEAAEKGSSAGNAEEPERPRVPWLFQVRESTVNGATHDALLVQPPCCKLGNCGIPQLRGGKARLYMLGCRFLSPLLHDELFPGLCNRQTETDEQRKYTAES